MANNIPINNQRRRRYTINDVQIVHKWMSKYPSNYQEAFRKAAIELNRTQGAINIAYYSNILFKNYFLTNPIMGLVTNDRLVEVNRKVCANREGISHPDDIQTDNSPMGIRTVTHSGVIIRMQSGSFRVGDVLITGENIQIETF